MKTNKNKGFRIENLENGKRLDLYCTGYIGQSWWDDDDGTYFGVKEIKNALTELKSADTVNIYINSFGGSFFEGMAVYNLLREYKNKITTHVVGACMSAATLILLAGKKRVANTGGVVMIHEPLISYMSGNAKELRKTADELDILNSSMLDVYEEVTGYDRAELENMVKEETYLDATLSTEYGFSTEQCEMQVAAIAQVPKALSNLYKKLPDNLREKEEPTIRDAERALRDAGFTNKDAKEIVSKGFKSEEQRDVVEDENKQAEIKAQLEKINKLFKKD